MKDKVSIALCLLAIVAILSNGTVKVESGVPAVVNPIGYDRGLVAKSLDSIIAECQKTTTSNAAISNAIIRKMFDLPVPMYTKLESFMDKYYKQPTADVAKLVILQCQVYKEILK